jgi:hypothetical protein
VRLWGILAGRGATRPATCATNAPPAFGASPQFFTVTRRIVGPDPTRKRPAWRALGLAGSPEVPEYWPAAVSKRYLHYHPDGVPLPSWAWVRPKLIVRASHRVATSGLSGRWRCASIDGLSRLLDCRYRAKADACLDRRGAQVLDAMQTALNRASCS